MVRPLPYILQRHRHILGIAPDALVDVEAVDCITALNIQDTLDVVSCNSSTAVAVRSQWTSYYAYGEWVLHPLHTMHSRIAHYDATMSYTVYHQLIELDGISYVVWHNIHTYAYRVWILY